MLVVECICIFRMNTEQRITTQNERSVTIVNNETQVVSTEILVFVVLVRLLLDIQIVRTVMVMLTA